MMLFLTSLIAAQAFAGASAPPPACRAAQLRLSVDGRDGDFNGMSHSGTALTIRNLGADCTLPALPTMALLDAHGRMVPASRRAPIGMHPGPVMLPVRLGGGHRAVTELRWVSGPVFAQNRSVRATAVMVRIGNATLRAPLKALLYGEARKPVTFDQTPLRAAEGMAAG